MTVLEETDQAGEFLIWCPGCEEYHAIWTDAKSTGPKWNFNGDMERPTFSPSLKVTMGPKCDPVTHLAPKGAPRRVCHSFIRNGMWEFLNDCTHKLAEKTVPMIDAD